MELEESTFLTSDYTTSYSHQDSMVLEQKQKYRWSNIESPHINLCIFVHLIFAITLYLAFSFSDIMPTRIKKFFYCLYPPSHMKFTHLRFINHLLRQKPTLRVVWQNGATYNPFHSFVPFAWGITYSYFFVSLKISLLTYVTLISTCNGNTKDPE